MKLIGLIGNPLGHSFSNDYFNRKFEEEQLTDWSHRNFELPSLDHLTELFIRHPDLVGFNVTIPYKQKILPYLDYLVDPVPVIGAVNTVIVSRRSGKITLSGYNTDYTGFRESLVNWLDPEIKNALIFGTGGSAQAIGFVLSGMDISYQMVSRSPQPGQLSYPDIDQPVATTSRLWINCTPVGMYPAGDRVLGLPFNRLTPDHYLFDLVYNPAVTTFMAKGKQKGAKVKNGLEMLIRQAEASWHIWTR